MISVFCTGSLLLSVAGLSDNSILHFSSDECMAWFQSELSESSYEKHQSLEIAICSDVLKEVARTVVGVVVEVLDFSLLVGSI